MQNILITGATGNVGVEVLKSLQESKQLSLVTAAVRDPAVDRASLKAFSIRTVRFDLEDSATFAAAFKAINVLFLMRPPQIWDVKKYFKPLIDSAVEAGIKHIVFLSVQGVETSSFIPHHKIEKLIVESRIPYTLLRPAYFMQNFTTTLRNEIVRNQRVFLPAGNARFTLVDVRDIGTTAAIILTNPKDHINKCYELTCHQKLTFYEIAEQLSLGLGRKIKFKSPDLFTFYRAKQKEEMSSMLILVMIMLHFFPRFKKEPRVTDCIEKITGKQPITFNEFIDDNKELLTQQTKNNGSL